MIAKAHARDLLTTPYVFDPAEAGAMARAGADILVCHFGLTVGGSIGAATATKLEDCPALTDAMAEAALAVNPRRAHSRSRRPDRRAGHAEYVLARARHCDGFYGASSMERLPVERALSAQVAKFKSIRKTANQSEEQARGGPHGQRAGGSKMSVAILGSLIIWLIVAVIVIAIVVYFVNWLYRRSSKEVSFVRTGLFGEKVVINSGAFVLPFIHEVTPVNMNVLRMQVVRNRDDALITKDRMRVDIESEFYVRVPPTPRGGDHRRRHARPAHHECRRPRCASLRQVRLGAALRSPPR